jgi:hypothetical protein
MRPLGSPVSESMYVNCRQRLLGVRLLAPKLGLPKLALDDRHEPRRLRLVDEIVGPEPHHRGGRLFGQRARHDDERDVQTGPPQQVERADRIEPGQSVIGDDQIPIAAGERRLHLGCGLDAKHLDGSAELRQLGEQ